ncbi:MAG TPA: hypothetical protein VLW65_20685 [Bryobacteraceae bacterium]|nr:hypothetical protein [Bryobacteraceae bacterium]
MTRIVLGTSCLPFFIAAALLSPCFGQIRSGGDAAATGAGAPADSERGDNPELPKFGIAVGAGTLGAGIQAATALARHTNLRGGFNYFSFGLSGTNKDNLRYDATLRLSSAEILLDQYIKGPFHISGGALIYDGFKGTADVSVPGQQSLTLNNVTYYSSASNPVTGTAAIGARKVAPEILIGFGNLLPRSARHFSVNFDLGVALQGSPNTKLNLLGSTCGTPTAGCSPIASDPSVQSNITAEQSKVNNDLKPFQFYPVIRLSFGYKF